jgi:hypothetical protein
VSAFLVKQKLLDWLYHQSELLDDTAKECIDLPKEMQFLYTAAYLRSVARNVEEGFFDWTGEGD